MCITATPLSTASSRPSSVSRSTSFLPNTWMICCTETHQTPTIPLMARCGTVTFCPSSTRRALTASISSANRCGRENANNADRKPICCTPANHIPARSSTPANHTPLSGSCYRKTRKDATAGPMRCSGRREVCDMDTRYIYIIKKLLLFYRNNAWTADRKWGIFHFLSCLCAREMNLHSHLVCIGTQTVLRGREDACKYDKNTKPYCETGFSPYNSLFRFMREKHGC